MGRGVACGRCGASTPLPDDIRVPSFRCAYCGVELATSAYVGREIASAEAMRQHFQAIAKDPREAMQSPAPRLEGGNRETRESRCRRCGAPVQVPLDLHARAVACGACGHTDGIAVHVSDKERFFLDMQRQMEGNKALARLRAEGVPCHACGARNPVTDVAAVQVVCKSCGAAILLSEHVPADAVARSRLKLGVSELRAGIAAQQKRAAKVNVIVTLSVFGAFALAAVVAIVLGLLSHR
jgi:DNA-directed RNA polymerase subunit RPC12/RpoP